MVLPQHLIATFFVATAGLFVTVLPEVIVRIIFSLFVAHVVYVSFVRYWLEDEQIRWYR
jgi:uncharacterized membrane protein YdbT with pleckstrin-like domain